MFDPLFLIILLTIYVLGLLQLARHAENRAASGKPLTDNALVYSFSLATYCTSWTFYGSVGKAVDSGLLFLTIYIGPTLSLALWWVVVRKLVRLKSSFHISSIADILAARYGKSHRIGALATIMCFAGSVPYVALQLKSSFTTFSLLVGENSWLAPGTTSVLISALMIVYTILLGVRRIDPTDRHPGLVAAVTAESVLKLAALVSVGLLALSVIKEPANLPSMEQYLAHLHSLGGPNLSSPYVTWASYLLLAMSAIIFLPHQFHLAVVENSDEKHILTASWLFPLYLLVLNAFVLPIALAGLASGLSPKAADTFVLALPLKMSMPWLTLFVFFGGFSAAMGMVMVSAVTNAVMLSNHVFLPVIEKFEFLHFLRRRLLQCRFAAVAVLILMAYWFEAMVGESYILVNIGIIAFGAALQFAPAILGGIFWKGGTRSGAAAGLTLGFAFWLHTMLLPALARSGGVWAAPMRDGLFGISWLKPEELFGLSGLDPVTHSVFWSLLFNAGAYVLVSLITGHAREELAVLGEFAGLVGLRDLAPASADQLEVELAEKRRIIEATLSEYLTTSEASELVHVCLSELGLAGRQSISVTLLAELYGRVEKAFSGVVGAAAAHKALSKSGVFSLEETRSLGEAYGGLLARMRLTPDDLVRRIDYYIEREYLFSKHAEELKGTIRLRDQEILRRKEVEEALRKAEEKYRGIFQNAPEGIFQCTTQGHLVSANPAMARILGYASAEELLGQETEIGGEILASLASREADMSNSPGGLVEGMEIPLPRKDGTKFWGSVIVRFGSSPERGSATLEGMLSDVTERRLAVEELRESEARIRALLDATSDSVVLTSMEGTILAVNEHGARRRGLSPEAMIGQSLYDHLPQSSAAARMFYNQEATFTRSARTYEEKREGRYYSITIYPVLDDSGEPKQLASFSRDITASREAEETIRFLNENLERRVEERTRQLAEANSELTKALNQLTSAHKQLVESEKMASLGGLVAGVAHEINTPLGIGVTAASHLEQKTKDILAQYREGGLKRASLEEYLSSCDESSRMILSNLRRAADLVRSFKQVAVDRSTEEKRNFMLRAYLDEVLLSLRPHLKKTALEVALDCDPELTMHSYPGALSQIITNLVMNSLIHAFDPGQPGKISISAKQNGSDVSLVYSDNGKGMAKEHLDKIFEPFYTTMRGRGGTGLGLHILYNLVTQKLRGSVSCESSPGQGATFSMLVPRDG